MSGIGTRGGIGGGILAEKVEILWGDRGNPRQHALRKGELVDVQRIIDETRKSLADLRKSLELVKGDIDELNAAVDGIVEFTKVKKGKFTGKTVPRTQVSVK